MSPTLPDPEMHAPDEEIAARCPYCDRPFLEQRLHDLHLGEVHSDELMDDERDAFERAHRSEEGELFFFHLRVVIALGVVYSMSVIGYAALVQLLG